VNGVAVLPRGSRLSPTWAPGVEATTYAVAQGFSPAEIATIGEDFRDYWTAKAGKEGVKLDWQATWRRWVRSQSQRRPTGRSAEPKRVGFV
jgi:hypothetical protein